MSAVRAKNTLPYIQAIFVILDPQIKSVINIIN